MRQKVKSVSSNDTFLEKWGNLMVKANLKFKCVTKYQGPSVGPGSPSPVRIYCPCSGRSRISQGAPTTMGWTPTYYFAYYYRKLHENERVWTGGARSWRPLRSATAVVISVWMPTSNGFIKLSYVEETTGLAGESSGIGSKRGCKGPTLVTVTHTPSTPPVAECLDVMFPHPTHGHVKLVSSKTMHSSRMRTACFGGHH